MKVHDIFSATIAVVILAGVGMSLDSCSSKDEPVPVEIVPLTIAAISPVTGPYSTIVTITGTGFEGSIVVKFNGKAAQVNSSTVTQLIVEVPKAAGTGPVSIHRGNETAIGPEFQFIPVITVSTLAGTGDSGFEDGQGAFAKFSYPHSVAVDVQGNVFVADRGNHRVRKVTPAGIVSTLAGAEPGFENGPGTSAKFTEPFGVSVDLQGNVYVAEVGNSRIRKITPLGIVSSFAGSGKIGFKNGEGATAEFNYPSGVAVDSMNNVYLADWGNHRIRKIASSGTVSTLAGNGDYGFEEGPGITAKFRDPSGVAVDGHGNVYVADRGNHRIRKISPSGVVSTLAGNGMADFANGSGASASFNLPNGIVVDAKGYLYAADRQNHLIRKITPSGLVSTLAGSGDAGFANGSGASAKFNLPLSVAVDLQGNVYVSDQNNHCIRKITIE